IENIFTPFFTESFEIFKDTEGIKGTESSRSTKTIRSIRNKLEEIILPFNTNSFVKLEVELEFFTNNINNSNYSSYQYNLCIRDNFDD
ncbi:17726_t:CDS:1, partial [Funneliformis caledonium]